MKRVLTVRSRLSPTILNVGKDLIRPKLALKDSQDKSPIEIDDRSMKDASPDMSPNLERSSPPRS